jgi:hypothetical protein
MAALCGRGKGRGVRRAELHILAPSALHGSLAATFGADVSLQDLPGPRSGKDPFDLANLARMKRPKALLLVAPRRRSLARLVPGPCIEGIPIGVIPADRDRDLEPWLNAWKRPTGGERLVLAMWKPFYLSLAERFARSIEAETALADRAERDTVCHLLAEGPRLAIYIGHGRPEGWSGYRGLRLHHLEAFARKRPIGTMLALACSNLKGGASQGFGQQLVLSGAACAFLGALDTVRIRPLARIADHMHEAMAKGCISTIGELLSVLDAKVRGDRELEAAWSHLRLVGDPMQPV